MTCSWSTFIRFCLVCACALSSALVHSGSSINVYEIAGMQERQSEVTMAYNSVQNEFLVVWVTEVNGVAQLFGRIVDDPSATPSSAIFQITALSNDSNQPDLVFNPSTNEYLLVWTYDWSGDRSDTDVYGLIIPANGPNPTFPSFTVANSTALEGQPAVGLRPGASAVTGFAYLVAWQELPFQSIARLQMQLFDQAGVEVGGVVGTPVIPADVSEPEIPDEPLGNRQQVVFSTTRGAGNIEAAIFTVANDTISNVQLQTVSGFPGVERQPDIGTCNGSWHYNWVGDDEIYMRSMNSNLELGAITRLSPANGFTQHRDPAIGCRSDEALISHAWAGIRQVSGNTLYELWNYDTLDESLYSWSRTYVQDDPIRQPALAATTDGSVLVAAAVEGVNSNLSDIDGFGYRSRIRDTERAALIDFYWNAGGPSWISDNNWLAAPGTECLWQGISCAETVLDVTVIGLDQSGNGLAGSISPQLAQLPNLTALRLEVNDLAGPFPLDLLLLDGLQILVLSNNKLSGPIPQPQANQWPNLNWLILNDNQFTGPIPSELLNLERLTSLYLGDNLLDGVLPEVQSNQWSFIEVIDLQDNNIQGSIPASWLSLDSLRQLVLSLNQLSGSLPSPGPGQWPNLGELLLNANRLSGPIPLGLAELNALRFLSLEDNQLSGNFPESLLAIDTIEFIDVFGNELSGALPNPGPGDWLNLNFFDVRDNRFSGGIPSSWGALPSLRTWLIGRNGLVGELPDSLLSSSLNIVDLRWNALTTDNPALEQYLNVRQAFGVDWRDSQTVSPASLSTQMGGRSALLEWSAPTSTQNQPGYYRLWSRLVGEPWTFGGQTMDKNSVQLPLVDLVPDSAYEFAITTVTLPHMFNVNTVESALEPMWMISTGPDCPPMPDIRATWGFPDTLLESNLVFADYLWHNGATQGFTIVPTDMDDWAWLQTTHASGCREHARRFISNTIFADSFE